MDAAALAARSGKAVWLVQLLRWSAPTFTGRWTTGGFLLWGEEAFQARTELGTLGDLPTFEDGVDEQTTRAAFTFFPADDEALAIMASGSNQTSLIEVYEAAVDPETGLMVGEPDPLFRGVFDYSRIMAGETTQLVIECGTEEALLTEPNEHRRLSQSHHSSVWPGELGLIYVTGVTRKIYWRQNDPGGAITSGGNFSTSSQ